MHPAAFARLACSAPAFRAAAPAMVHPLARQSKTSASVLETLAASVGAVPRVLLRDTARVRSRRPWSIRRHRKCPVQWAGYQVFGEIARGGMGAVFKGRDPDLGRDLAVKVLLEQHSETSRTGPSVRRGGADRRPVAASGNRAGLRAGHVRRRPALFHDEAGQGPDAGRVCWMSGRPDCRAAAHSWASSSTFARRSPTPTPRE